MDKLDNIIELYFTTLKLKNMLRTGWCIWKVEGVRVESIAEHVFGTLMLAVSIQSNIPQNLNFEKVAVMLALHETEEIIIGDITPFDKEKRKTKREDGKRAVNALFYNCCNKQYFLDIIEEFEQNKTLEAKFAHQCDKFEADLQAYAYRNNFNYNNVNPKIWEDISIKNLVDKGYKNTEKLFLQSDMHYYDGVFLQLANKLKTMEEN